jgi:predicted metal-dependent HD superfamily phosphohydrolase
MADLAPASASHIDKNAQLFQNWIDLGALSGIKEEVCKQWWTQLSTRYSEPKRYYHTLNHISELNKWVEKYDSEIENAAAVRYAVWFHDVVYDATKNDNEEQSEELWRQFSQESGLNQELSDKVSMYIIATKTHKPPIWVEDDDLALFLDFDTAILAADEDAYNQYAAQIRAEYIHVPLELYKKGRAAVLQHFLDNDPFVTELFRQIYGAKAKENMQREITSLHSLAV